MKRQRRPWVRPASVMLAMLISLLPLPDVLQPWRPYWLALVLAYWAIETPDELGLGVAFIMGIIADILTGGRLGEQALRLVVLLFLVRRFRARLRFFPMLQQALIIGVLLLNDRVVLTVIHLSLGEPLLPWSYWWAPLVGAGVWLPLLVFLDRLRSGQHSWK